MRISDETALGSAAAIIASLPQLAIHEISFQLGWTSYHAHQIATAIYLNKQVTESLGKLFYGYFLWLISSAIIGILIVYYLKMTGHKYWWLKGLLVDLGFMYIAVYGFFYNLGAQVVPSDLRTNIIILVDNIVFSITTSYLIRKWWGLENHIPPK